MLGIPVLGPSGERVSPQRDREEWKAVRGPRFGSSDLPAVLGHDEYQGPWQVWDRIVLGKWDESESADIRRGNRQEPNALARFSEQFELEVKPEGMIHHVMDERIVSDLDGVVIRPAEWPEQIRDNALWDYVMEECSGNGALEAKVPRTPRYFQYRDTGMLKSHAIQMQHHLEVSGFEWGVLTFYNPEYDQCIAFPVIAMPKLGEWIRTEIPAWYRRYIEPRVRPMRPLPPPPEWPPIPPGIATVREDPAWMDQTLLLKLRYYELLEAQEAYDDTETALLALIEDSSDDYHITGGGVVVKRFETTGKRLFDRKRFLAKLTLAQMEKNTDALLTINHEDDDFYYQTEPKKKVEVKVTGPNPAEVSE